MRLDACGQRFNAQRGASVVQFPQQDAQPSSPSKLVTDVRQASSAKPAHAYPQTDLGNACYFAALFGDALRFDGTHKRWLEWRNHRWEPNGRAAEAAQT